MRSVRLVFLCAADLWDDRLQRPLDPRFWNIWNIGNVRTATIDQWVLQQADRCERDAAANAEDRVQCGVQIKALKTQMHELEGKEDPTR